MMKSFSGQSASVGFVKAKVLVLKNEKVSKPSKKSEGIECEYELLKMAIKKAIDDLTQLQTKATGASAEILTAHLMLLEDPEAIEQCQARITQGQSAEVAYYEVIEEFRLMFLQVADELIRQRAVDLQDIRERVIFYLQNTSEKFPDLALAEPAIIIARDLTPSQIFSIDKKMLMGFVCVEGGSTSHTAILARSLEIPAIMGAQEAVLGLSSGAEVLMNAEIGMLYSDFNPEDLNSFLERQKAYVHKQLQNALWKGKVSATSDGHALTLAANISGPQDLKSFHNNDAESVGLYRTEFLFLDRELAPTEEEQYKIYKEVFDGLNGKHILVRTLDIGGDKKATYLNMKHEENPFLGIRALRLCFQRPDIFKTQLRALLRAGVKAQWGLMFPMVSQLEELLQAKSFVDEVKTELTKENKAFSQNFEIGIMIEIPSAAWMMPVLAPHVDFISIGTNDLLQYTCAADRLNPELKSVYNPYNVGFLRQIHFVLKTCADLKVHSGICGSLSHHQDLMAFFVGCGVNELSMTSQHVLSTRTRLNGLNYTQCVALVDAVLSCGTSAEVKSKFTQLFENSLT
jgi:phosphoenolpyruvate-protein phosphotransferase (PTS system enzyme I)